MVQCPECAVRGTVQFRWQLVFGLQIVVREDV